MTGTGLFGSVVLEVAVGLFFVYLLLSLICSSINELIASVLKWRAKNLEQGIRNLICDPELFTAVMAHPLIKAMGNTRTDAAPVQLVAGQNLAGKPSYIPSRVFALAMLDSLMPARGDQLNVATLREQAQALIDTEDARKQQIGGAVNALISESRDPKRVAQQLDAIKRMVEQLPAAPGSADEQKLKELVAIISPANTLDDIERAVTAILPDSTVRGQVLGILDGVRSRFVDIEYELDTVHKNVARWYDDAMDRVSGTYKRKTQTALFVIALLLSLFLGADSVRIVANLSINPTLRQALVEEADRQTGAGGALQPGGTGQTIAPQTPTPGTTTPSTQPAGTQSPSISDLVNQLKPFSALFGYGDMPAIPPGGVPTDAWYTWLFWRFLGTMMTVFAISLGAPFWFDVLNKVANLRGVGKRPEPPTQPAAVVVTSTP